MNKRGNKKVLARIGERLGRKINVTEFVGLKRPVGRPKKTAFITQSIVNATIGLSFVVNYYKYKVGYVLPKVKVISRDEQKLRNTIIAGSQEHRTIFNVTNNTSGCATFIVAPHGAIKVELGLPLNKEMSGSPFPLRDLDGVMRRVAGTIAEWSADVAEAKRIQLQAELAKLRSTMKPEPEPVRAPSFKERVLAFEKKCLDARNSAAAAAASREQCIKEQPAEVAQPSPTPHVNNGGVTITFGDGSKLCIDSKVKVTVESIA